MEEDLLVGHSVTSAGGLREIFRKIGVGAREHSWVLTSFAEAIFFADSENLRMETGECPVNGSLFPGTILQGEWHTQGQRQEGQR